MQLQSISTGPFGQVSVNYIGNTNGSGGELINQIQMTR